MNLFRPPEEMMRLFYWIVLGQAVIVLAFVLIYASGFAGGGIGPGSGSGLCSNCLRLVRE